ncbi:hypothetical protein BDQ12DRAFT_677860 [Crucibulum laeve]|uniref:Uncharacterized protein n=1 Tax=Crucibulum laeve TaxID=68775 RepID=A0A5C3MAH1_9AGAR|nr:hypothetical protein BDQ12DRAFT_677860 [Crucibulum laeve]
MLWRAISRSTSILRQNSAYHQRSLHVTRSLKQYYPPPASWSSRVFFKRDGTPRSKLKGVAFGSITFVTLYTMYTMLEMLQEFEASNYLLMCLVHIQRADNDLLPSELSNAPYALSHFRELCDSFKDIPHNMFDDFFNDIDTLITSRNEGYAQAHKMMKQASEEVHEVLHQSKGRDPWETAVDAIRILDEAIVGLVELVEGEETDDEDVRARYQKLREQKVKEPPKSNEYEVVG